MHIKCMQDTNSKITVFKIATLPEKDRNLQIKKVKNSVKKSNFDTKTWYFETLVAINFWRTWHQRASVDYTLFMLQ